MKTRSWFLTTLGLVLFVLSGCCLVLKATDQAQATALIGIGTILADISTTLNKKL
jgi:hypothetical protein